MSWVRSDTQAFIAFINLHLLFSNRTAEPKPAARVAVLEMPTDKQHKLGGAFQSVVDRYASDIEDGLDEDEDHLSLASAQREVVFLQLVAVFVGAVRCGVLDVELAKEPLEHYGRFGSTYDALVKKLVDVLRDEGIFNKQADTVQHVVSEALQNVSEGGMRLTCSRSRRSWSRKTRTILRLPPRWPVWPRAPLSSTARTLRS